MSLVRFTSAASISIAATRLEMLVGQLDGGLKPAATFRGRFAAKSQRSATTGLALIALSVLCCAGCNSGPAAIRPPSISASGAGSKAMELYDKDGDGKVSGAELDAAPALKAAMATLDTDGDKAVSAAEVTARVKSWQATPAALTMLKARVTLDGQPLGNAKVVFEPDPCLGDNIKAATGTTNLYGDVSPTIAPEDRPSPSWPGGIQLGLYIVKISKEANGKEVIPARYNTQTVLGQQVSGDDPAMQARNVAFTLKSVP